MTAVRNDSEYVRCYLARLALLTAIGAYDAAGFPASEEVRGRLITAALHLAAFRQPPGGRYVADMEGPEDWFGVL